MGPTDVELLARASARAIEWFAAVTRKGTDVPYVSHLFAVAALVLEHGGTAEQAAAALLHDALEDVEGLTADDLAREFGAEVARIVVACTDTLAGDTPTAKSAWGDRKRPYVAHLREADDAEALVAACDKRHNLASIVADVAAQGPGYLDRFNGSPAQQLWYYGELADVLRGKVPPRLTNELASLLDELRALLPGVEPWVPPGT